MSTGRTPGSCGKAGNSRSKDHGIPNRSNFVLSLDGIQGHLPGAIPLSEIATAVEAIDDAVGSLLVPSLMKLVGTWKNDLGERENARRHGLVEIMRTMNDLVEKKAVRGISHYSVSEYWRCCCWHAMQVWLACTPFLRICGSSTACTRSRQIH